MKKLFIILSILFLAASCVKDASQSKRQMPEPAQVFQPEEKMLTQSINPSVLASKTVAAQTKQSNQGTASSTTAGSLSTYSYTRNICQISYDQKFSCIDAYYRNLVATFGIDNAFKDIKQRYTEDPYIVAECHPVMHVIGQAASKLYSTVSEAYLHGDSFCWSGYYHGIMEGVIAKIGRKNLPTKLDTICADIPGKQTYNFNYYNCVHGLGHGIMEISEDELFDSLKMCDNLTGNWEQLSCYSGVFMENIIADGKNHSTKYLKPSEPLYPCTAVDDKYKSQCYLGQTSYALQVTGNDFTRVFALCATVAQPFRDICNQSMGRDAASQALHEAQRTKSNCWLTSDPNDRTNCVIGAVKEIISNYHSETEALAFCAILDDANKNNCATTADSYYSHF